MTLRKSLLFALAALCLMSFAAPSQAQAPKPPKWSYAFDLACRKFNEAEFTKDTKKWGVEVFKDDNNGLGVYVAQSGVVGVVSNFGGVAAPVKDSKAPEWTSGLDLKSRKAGEAEFTDNTKTYALEVFFDTNSQNWVYITENGYIAVAPGKFAKPDNLVAPEWLYSYDLKCRKGGTKEFDDKTPQYGIEVYKDKNNGNLIYICQTGSIAIVPEGGAKAGEQKPEWLHGQDLQCRKYGEAAFGKDTRKYGVELFRDGHNGNVIALSETGNIAVVSTGKDYKSPTANPKDAKFTHGLDLSCRQAGEKNFTPTTKTYAMEVFGESNIGVTLYICESGAIGLVANKK